jgi:serine/threonine-protein kinase
MDPNAIALFRELADRSSAEREAYYVEHHIDSALRAEVESLLRFDRQPADSLHHRVASAAARAIVERRRLGVFEIQELLGVGGMGEVYRARDTRLGRDVAIKILTRAFRDDPEHVMRFEREARVLASLNHPHIGVIHGLEEVDGLKALVMELVPGKNLAERLAHGPLPIADALDIAHQVADALEAAHAQGIVHRDLKPANIKRRPDGTVKVLDFGLAKTLGPTADAASITETGTVGGTPAYMSPEQARGEPLDAQADIWSFGVVVFELMTGVSPFARKSTADTFACVLSSAPDYSLLPPGTPPNVWHLIRRCLEKDRRRRLKHIGDARLELEQAISSSSVDVSSSPALDARTVVPRVWGVRRAAAFSAAGLVAGAILGTLWLAPRRASSPVVRSLIPADALVSGTDRSFAFTADGRSLAFINSDARQMFVRPLDALDPLVVLTTASYIRGMYPSPNGRWFAYIENNFTLKKISTSGGAPVTIVELDGPSRGAAWGPDDTIVFGTGASDTGLQRVASGGGAITVLTRPDHERGEADHVQPAWLPDGRRLLFTILPTRGGLAEAKVAVLDVTSGATRTVMEGAYAARYIESGHLVYAAADGLWGTRFDVSRLETQGVPVELLRGVTIETVGGAAEFDIAPGGTLAYSGGDLASHWVTTPVWVDRQGRETPLAAPPGNYRHPRIAPDGKRVAIDPHGSGEGEIYVWEHTRPWSTAVRMTVAAGNDWFPVWTPEGHRLVFGSWRAGFSNLYRLDLQTGLTERLTESPDMQLPTSITPDGGTVIFHSFTKSLQALRLDRHDPMTLVETPGEERNGDLSPDGRWLAYEGESESIPGQLDIYVRRFPDVNRGLWQVTRDGGTFPLWSRDGRELFYARLDGTIVAVPVEPSGTAWNAGSPTALFRGRYFLRDGSLGRHYDVAPDGRFLMLKRAADSVSPHLVVVQNWLSEVASRLP